MCAICCENNNLRLITNVDPTHTLSTRRRFVADIDKRFRALKKEVIEHIEAGSLLKRDNPFGGFTINVTASEWRSRYDPDRIPEFLEWLEEQNNKFILSKSGSGIQVFSSQTTPLFPGQASFDAKTQTTTRVLGGVEGRWTDVHIRSAYQKGVQQARINLRKQGIDIPSFESTAEGLSGVFNAPFHADRVQLAFTQTYSGLQGVTKAMEAPIARTIALGMAEGRNPKALAREIARIKGTIDKAGLNRARTLARTEVIRAHHGANIAEFRAIGIEEVIIKAEWLTAGDNRVCPRCESLEGQIFKLDEIEPMIPLHPNCRCLLDGQVKIYTSKGWKKIKDIRLGEMVLTHKKGFMKVIDIIRTPKQVPDAVRFGFGGTQQMNLSVTDNHKILIDDGWVEAKNLKIGFAATSRMFADFQRLGLLNEVTGHSRNRLFVLSEYLTLFK